MSELQGKSKTIFMSKKEHKRVDDEAKIHLELWGLKFMKIKASAQGKKTAERGSKCRWARGQSPGFMKTQLETGRSFVDTPTPLCLSHTVDEKWMLWELAENQWC